MIDHTTGLTAEEMKLFVEIIQMIAIIDEAMQTYLREYREYKNDTSITNDFLDDHYKSMERVKKVWQIFKRVRTHNSPAVEHLYSTVDELKHIRNNIAHNRNYLVVSPTLLPNMSFNPPESIGEMNISQLYEKASALFVSLRDFIECIYFQPEEQEYQHERKVNLYGAIS